MDDLALALRYLERRARTEAEVRQKLMTKGVAPTAIDEIIQKLNGLGYLNDAQFARNWQRARNDYKPTGWRRLRLELRQKGLPKALVSSVGASRDEEAALALKAAQSRLRQYQGLDSTTFRRRLAGFLARRGFDYAAIKYVFEQLKTD